MYYICTQVFANVHFTQQKYTNQMTITNETRATWEPLRERSDVKKLRAITGLSRTAIYDIYKDGECEMTVAAQFIKFYEEKAALKKIIEQDQD